MLSKYNIFIIIFPFLSIFLSSLIFLVLQNINNKNYFYNLILSFILILCFIIFFILKIFISIENKEILYIIFSYSCLFHLFMCLIQAQISSVQLTLLRMINLNPNLNKKKLLKKYNANKMFNERVKRLESGGIILKKKSFLLINNNKIKLYLGLTQILRKIFNPNNTLQ